MRRLLVLLSLAGAPSLARADRAPVAVLWLGEGPIDESAQRTVDEVNAALARSQGARPLDSVDDRRALVEGGPATRVEALVARAEAWFVKLKYADAARDYEAAEQILFHEVPFEVERQRLAAVERNLLACYDQLGKADKAQRAADRLSFTAGSNEDLAALLAKYPPKRTYQPALPPVRVSSEPPGAIVYRDLLEIGPTPVGVAGGDPAVEIIDVEAPGYRRVHLPLKTGLAGDAEVQVTLAKEDRLGVLVDHIRQQAPDAPPAEVAALGRRVGAVRVLVLYPDGPKKLLARYLDVSRGKWADASLRVDASGPVAMERLAGYASPTASAQPAAAAVAQAPPPARTRLGAWGKWYTWVAAGAVVALVVGLLIAEHVGDDKLTVTATH
jgi:hypothetical protein